MVRHAEQADGRSRAGRVLRRGGCAPALPDQRPGAAGHRHRRRGRAAGRTARVLQPGRPARPAPLSRTALLVQAALVYLPLPVLGAAWVSLPGFLAGSALPVLRPWAAWTTFTGVVVSVGVAQEVLARDHLDVVFNVVATFVNGLVVFALGTLSRLAAEVRQTRDELVGLVLTEERLRFARDLHDLLGLSLSAITMNSELIRRLIHRGGGRGRAGPGRAAAAGARRAGGDRAPPGGAAARGRGLPVPGQRAAAGRGRGRLGHRPARRAGRRAPPARPAGRAGRGPGGAAAAGRAHPADRGDRGHPGSPVVTGGPREAPDTGFPADSTSGIRWSRPDSFAMRIASTRLRAWNFVTIVVR
ncbi:hypothetical protein BN6_37220 [Saccharothrix espanaensis DSM 44229]|uniref:Signal transduction histidine kinase subgroup 3 dimerisation and phosphoacceptor domain-containing protein n=1 Tax=Saccharothrix espanaensis (strain ATCC 51144 / DSM 44229 / JCM 9112 / NBRC 15066 / NRRL 15764) TaxID=1179773 RepID=K0JTA0_SACES|nr:hypothetical protein BN6_37220 [Saccharothrix espanaensis DSM 44229]